MSKKSGFNWLPSKKDDDDPFDFSNADVFDWDDDLNQEAEDDESHGAEDYFTSRPWTDE